MSKQAKSPLWVGALIIATAAFAAGFALSYLEGERTAPAHIDGLLWPDPPLIEQLQLVDQNSEPVTEEALRGRWSLVFFGFTHCPDICPTTLEVMARAHRELKSHARYGELGQVVFVSLDPERDSPAVLRDYVGYFDSEFIGATAPDAQLAALTRRLGVLFMKVPQGGAAYTIDHSAGIFFIDPALRLVSVMTPPHDVAAVVKRFDEVSAFIESTL